MSNTFGTLVADRTEPHRKRSEPRHRAAVLGLGLLAPGMGSPGELLRCLRRAVPADQGLVPAADLERAAGLGPRDRRKLDRFSLLGLAAARAALRGAGLSSSDTASCGIVTGNVAGGWTFTESQLRALHAAGPGAVSPYLATAWFPAAPQGQISIHLGLRGFAKTLATDRTAGLQAIAMAAARIASGRPAHLLAGGVEAPVTPFVEAAFAQAWPMAEAAAYLLLGPALQGDVYLTAHEVFALGAEHSNRRATLMTRLAGFFMTKGPRRGPGVFTCDAEPSDSLAEEAAAVVERMAQGPVETIYPARTLGDTLGAGGAVAALAAVAALQSDRETGWALACSTGRHCSGFLMFQR